MLPAASANYDIKIDESFSTTCLGHMVTKWVDLNGNLNSMLTHLTKSPNNQNKGKLIPTFFVQQLFYLRL